MADNNLLILGAGQYGHVVKEIAEAMGCFNKIDFLDDRNEAAIGKINDYESFHSEYTYGIAAIGNPRLRLELLDKLESVGYVLPTLIHPQAYISPSAKLMSGVVVEPMAVVNTDVIVEKGVFLCAGSAVNHNSVIHAVCQIDCNAVVPSSTIVPEGTKVFSGTVFHV